MGGLEVRRSTRVLVQVPIFVAGRDNEGVPFEAPGETLMVNKHGAKIRTAQALQRDSVITVSVPSLNRSRPARVVWVEERDTEPEREFGIELENPENFWGIYFPPSDWKEAEVSEEEKPLAVEPVPQPVLSSGANQFPRAEISEPVHSSVLAPASSGAVFSSVEIPARGVEVFVRGISATRTPFQERTLLRPVDQQEATIYVRPVVDIGTQVQVILPGNRPLKARTSGVGGSRYRGRWKMWIRFTDPIKIVRPVEAG